MTRAQGRDGPLYTPDGRYIVVRGRLWRAANPHLAEAKRVQYVGDLMDARRMVKAAKSSGDADAEKQARSQVHAAKVLLGERGPVWWTDGAPDYGRKMARNTPYADWFVQAERTTT